MTLYFHLPKRIQFRQRSSALLLSARFANRRKAQIKHVKHLQIFIPGLHVRKGSVFGGQTFSSESVIYKDLKMSDWLG